MNLQNGSFTTWVHDYDTENMFVNPCHQIGGQRDRPVLAQHLMVCYGITTITLPDFRLYLAIHHVKAWMKKTTKT